MKKNSTSNGVFSKKYALAFALALLGSSFFIFKPNDKVAQTTSSDAAQKSTPTVASQHIQSAIAPQMRSPMPVKKVKPTSTKPTGSLHVEKLDVTPPQYSGLRKEKKVKTLADRAAIVGDRLKFEFNMLKNPATGKIPIFAKQQSLESAVSAPAYEPIWGAESIPGMTLSVKGPTNLGGKVRTIGIDVSNTNIMLSGSTSSGIYRTDNAGASWTRVTPAGESHSVTAIAQDTRAGQTDTWYYGGGEAEGNSASSGNATYLGFGLWKSTDKGITWTKLPNTILNSGGNTTLQDLDNAFDVVHQIVVDPTNGNVYVAAANTIQRSTNGGTDWEPVLGTFSNNTTSMVDITVTPTGRLYAAFHGGDNNEGVWTSTTGAAGSWIKIAGTITGTVTPATWHAANAYGRVVLAYAPSSPNIVYVLYWNKITHEAGNPVPEGKLFKYDQTTNNWTDLSANLPDEPGYNKGNDPFACQEGYDLCIGVKPDDPNTVFIGGTNAYRSTNGFSSTAATTRIGGYAGTADPTQYDGHHSDIHAFVFATGANNVLFTGDDGGIHKADITATPVVWSHLNNNFVTYMYYHVDIAPTTAIGDLIIGGLQDNGTSLSSAGTTHDNIFSGDGGAVGFISYTSNSDYNFIVATQNGSIYRSNSPNNGSDIKPTGSSSIFNTYFHLDPDNLEHLYYAGKNILYRTRKASTLSAAAVTGDATTGWEQMTGSISGDIYALATARNVNFSGAAYSASNANRCLFIGTDASKIYRLNDPAFTAANTAPVDISPAGASGICSSISVNPYNYNEVLATYSNFGVPSVYHTMNAQSATPTWTNVEGPADGAVTLASARSCVIAKSGTTTYYLVGTSTGLYYANALSGTTTVWTKIGTNEINYALVSSMRHRIADNKIVVGTHGNGAFLLTLPSASLPLELLTLTGKGEKEGNRLSWTTAQERDVDGFEIQRSNTGDKNSFEAIGFIKANNRIEKQSYNFLDTKASTTAPQYYRLKMVEYDASKSAYTKIITIEPSTKRTITNFAVAPNPVISDMQIVFADEPLSNFTVNIMDFTGRIVRTQTMKNWTDKTLILPMSNLASGTYLINIVSPSGIKTEKFIKL